jgi:Holliday junction resolvasome RuvABC endonuclease subunit
MTTFIGIDPGTKCGWALLDAEGARLASGVWNLASRRHEGGGMRYVRARRCLGELLDSYPDSILGYEEIRRHVGTSAAHVYGGIVAVISSECEVREVPYSGRPVGSVKKHATGKGNANKELMIGAANRRWGPHMVQDDNEADALWIADHIRNDEA